MSITMRVIQRFDFKQGEDFMALEKKFAEMEARREDFRKGRRIQPIAAAEARNTLIGECEFPDLASAQKALDFASGDAEHDVLFKQQQPFFEAVKMEFFRNLDF